MTKHGSNALKRRARQLAAAEGISYTEALQRLSTAGSEAPPPAPAARWYRSPAARPGFHWWSADDGADLRVDVPDPRNAVWLERVAPPSLDQWDNAVPRFAADQRDVVLRALQEIFGRTGHDAIEHVDVDVHLDQVETHGRLGLTWAGQGLAHCTEHESWKEPRLQHCEAVTGRLLIEGDGAQRRITWEPGTVLRVRDVPRTSLEGQPTGAVTVVATSDDDPADKLRRAGHRMLGLRYRTDIPPVPHGGTDGRLPAIVADWPATLRSVPTDYPSRDMAEPTARRPRRCLDLRGARWLRRLHQQLHAASHTRPCCGHRRLREGLRPVPGRVRSCRSRRRGRGSAGRYRFTPQRLYGLLSLLRVADAADAVALTTRTEEQWAAGGWPLTGWATPVPQWNEPADPSKCWRASEAARCADAGIGARRAYELREDGSRILTVAEVIARDLVVPNDAGRTAMELLAKIAGPVSPEAQKFGTARTHHRVRLEHWSTEDRQLSGFGSVSGESVDLERHDFTLPDGTTQSLWAVVKAWWENAGEDPDAGDTRTPYLTEPEAHSAWRAERDTLATTPPTPAYKPAQQDRPCPEDGSRHCDNCGSPEVQPNAFLPLGWMTASLGIACSPTCYDAMSDAVGAHAQRHH